MNGKLNDLIAEYQAWYKDNGFIDAMSADELYADLLTEQHELEAKVEWLKDFTGRWEAAVRTEVTDA